MSTKTFYRANMIHWYSEPDDLEHGCDPDQAVTNTEKVKIDGETLIDLVRNIFEWIPATFDPASVEVDSCGEPGRIDIQVVERQPQGSEISAGEVMQALREQAARKARCRLTGETFGYDVWLTCYTVYVEHITVTSNKWLGHEWIEETSPVPELAPAELAA